MHLTVCLPHFTMQLLVFEQHACLTTSDLTTSDSADHDAISLSSEDLGVEPGSHTNNAAVEEFAAAAMVEPAMSEPLAPPAEAQDPAQDQEENMLLCDGCDNGFHSTCVGITPAEMAALTKGQHDASHSILLCCSVSAPLPFILSRSISPIAPCSQFVLPAASLICSISAHSAEWVTALITMQGMRDGVVWHVIMNF